MIGETTFDRVLIRGGGALLALIWIAPLAYAVWAAFHPPAFEARFELTAPLTLDNFAAAWSQAPFARYFLNTILLVTMILSAQLVLCTLPRLPSQGSNFPARRCCSH
jgi:sn-glycerol 3-phosphate transport system permease protein